MHPNTTIIIIICASTQISNNSNYLLIKTYFVKQIMMNNNIIIKGRKLKLITESNSTRKSRLKVRCLFRILYSGCQAQLLQYFNTENEIIECGFTCIIDIILFIQKCPFEAITIINLPSNLEKETTHRYSANSFKLHRYLPHCLYL